MSSTVQRGERLENIWKHRQMVFWIQLIFILTSFCQGSVCMNIGYRGMPDFIEINAPA